MEKFNKTQKNSEKAITLIALVITIIVLLILAGISISMLSGDNSILQKTTEAKQTSERAEAKEQAKIDIMAWITDKTANHEDASLDDTKVREILNDNKSYVKEAKESSFITTKGEYEIPYSELYSTTEEQATTIGQKYENSWIGRKITYTSDNGESNWVILGKDNAGDILITTANPVGSYTSKWGIEHVDEYDTDLRTACMSYKGKIGNNNVDVKEARNISVEDVNKTVEVSEENKTMIFSDGSDYWCSGVDHLNDVEYIASYIGSHTIFKRQKLYISAQYQGATSRTCKIRPVVVLSSTIPYDDIEIGDYWTYSSGYDSGSGYGGSGYSSGYDSGSGY